MREYDIADMSNRLLYQVTLASGRIVTSPEDFGDGENGSGRDDYYRPVFAEDGRLLTVAADGARLGVGQEDEAPQRA